MKCAALKDKPRRCFHCDEVFFNVADARNHFGYMEDGAYEEPGCKLTKDEKGLVGLLREAWAELRQYHEQDTPLFRQLYSLGGAHEIAKRQEEEAGYARGLRDGRELVMPSRDTIAKEIFSEVYGSSGVFNGAEQADIELTEASYDGADKILALAPPKPLRVV